MWYGFIGGVCVCIGTMVVVSKKNDKFYITIKDVLDKENDKKWHSRGIHWRVNPKLGWIQIMLNFNPGTGMINM